MTWGIWIVHNLAASQRCILALNHSALFKPTVFWNLFFDKQEVALQIWELALCGQLEQGSQPTAAVTSIFWENLKHTIADFQSFFSPSKTMDLFLPLLNDRKFQLIKSLICLLHFPKVCILIPLVIWICKFVSPWSELVGTCSYLTKEVNEVPSCSMTFFRTNTASPLF